MRLALPAQVLSRRRRTLRPRCPCSHMMCKRTASAVLTEGGPFYRGKRGSADSLRQGTLRQVTSAPPLPSQPPEEDRREAHGKEAAKQTALETLEVVSARVEAALGGKRAACRSRRRQRLKL
jgi:hypothetical protein